MLERKPPKPRPCKVCKTPYTPKKMGQKVCGIDCGLSFGREVNRKNAEKLAKAERIADKARLQSLKPLSYWAARAQEQVNRYIRLKQRGMPCISCNKPWQPDFQAGHYLSVGAHRELRFEPDNIHLQCIQCNMHKGGNAIQYRAGLVRRHGVHLVDALEAPHPLPKWTREDYQNIEAAFKALADELAKAEIYEPKEATC
jgi:Bacteriophage Lambda NinG protein